jgi:hypothetical protein
LFSLVCGHLRGELLDGKFRTLHLVLGLLNGLGGGQELDGLLVVEVRDFLYQRRLGQHAVRVGRRDQPQERRVAGILIRGDGNLLQRLARRGVLGVGLAVLLLHGGQVRLRLRQFGLHLVVLLTDLVLLRLQAVEFRLHLRNGRHRRRAGGPRLHQGAGTAERSCHGERGRDRERAARARAMAASLARLPGSPGPPGQQLPHLPVTLLVRRSKRG